MCNLLVQFMLRVEWHGRLLCSEPNSLPVISSGEKTKSKQDNGFQSVLIQLLETAVPSDKEAEEEETNNKVSLIAISKMVCVCVLREREKGKTGCK